jgi:hypothetical protein
MKKIPLFVLIVSLFSSEAVNAVYKSQSYIDSYKKVVYFSAIELENLCFDLNSTDNGDYKIINSAAFNFLDAVVKSGSLTDNFPNFNASSITLENIAISFSSSTNKEDKTCYRGGIARSLMSSVLNGEKDLITQSLSIDKFLYEDYIHVVRDNNGDYIELTLNGVYKDDDFIASQVLISLLYSDNSVFAKEKLVMRSFGDMPMSRLSGSIEMNKNINSKIGAWLYEKTGFWFFKRFVIGNYTIRIDDIKGYRAVADKEIIERLQKVQKRS